MSFIKKDSTYTRAFLMVSNVNHVIGGTNISVSVALSKAGANFAAAAGSITEKTNGWYTLALTTADTNTLGDLAYRCTGTNVDTTDFVDQIIGMDLNVPVVITGTNADKTGYAIITNNDKTGYSIAAGTQAGVIIPSVVNVKTILTPQAFDLTGNITGNLSGSVGTVTGGVIVTTNNDKTGYSLASGTQNGVIIPTVVTVKNVLDKTGYSLVSPQTFDLSGNITGNLSGSVGSILASVITGTNNDKTGYSLTAGQLFVKKNAILGNLMFLMLDSSDHVTPKTGLTITSQVSIDGAAFGATVNSASEVGSGIYTITLAAADTNGTTLMLKFSSAGADTRYMEIITQP